MNAATPWQKWSEDSIIGPSPYEWCLWSMVIKGERNYFSGKLIKVDDKVFLYWDGFTAFEPDDSVYFARVIQLPEKE